MKTKEELNAIKEDVETLNRKLGELTQEELEHVTGGLTDTELKKHRVEIVRDKYETEKMLKHGMPGDKMFGNEMLKRGKCTNEKILKPLDRFDPITP